MKTIKERQLIVGVLESGVEVEWVCKALTVPGEPLIRFLASESSASNGISSTKTRRIMCEAANEKLYEELKGYVFAASCLFSG